MARKLRIEYPGALYHVINRGNYRGDIFAEDGAKDAFEICLWEACTRAGWLVHAYVLMRNHYHIALETPEGNLVEGMRWLQATYANRFNRFRKENGHVFQGRYRALPVENLSTLGVVGHYIHLNPVRAGLLSVDRLSEYAHSSFSLLFKPLRRPATLSFRAVLEAAGGLHDTDPGRRNYREYLTWLAANEDEQKKLEFAALSRGWAVGSGEFKQKLIAEQQQKAAEAGKPHVTLREMRELAWKSALAECLRTLGKSDADITNDRKAASWKIAIAAHLKGNSTVTNPWLATALRMGAPEGVSRYVAELRAGDRPEAAREREKISTIKV